MSTFSVTLGNVLITLLYLSCGFALCKSKLVKPEHTPSISTILLYVCGPCMFIDALTALDHSSEMTGNIFLFLAVTTVTQALVMSLIFLVLGKRRNDFIWRMMALGSVMGNVGFFGLPIVKALFPEAPEAAAYSCIFCVTMNFIAWTIGIFVLTDDKKYISVKQAFVNPTLISSAVGFVLYLLNAKEWMPSILQGGIHNVGAMSTPVCMFVLGIRLATMNLKKLFIQPMPWITAMGKLIIFPLLSYLLVFFLPFSDVFKASILILSATPCASIILNLAEIHHNGQEVAANCTLLSTLVSIATIPLMSLLL